MSKTITTFDEDGRPAQMFPTPADKYVARGLWAVLIDNLQPGFIVQLSLDYDAAEITRRNGQKATGELYASLMEGKV